VPEGGSNPAQGEESWDVGIVEINAVIGAVPFVRQNSGKKLG
jgi:hypothetical protein